MIRFLQFLCWSGFALTLGALGLALHEFLPLEPRWQRLASDAGAHELVHNTLASAPTFQPDGKRTYHFSDGHLVVWDLDEGAELTRLPCIGEYCVSPDGSRVSMVEEATRLSLWDISRPRAPQRLVTLAGDW